MNGTNSSQLNVAISTALEAGKIIMHYFSRLNDLKIQEKGYNDYVSQADQESEKIIIKRLSKEYPEYKITSEECGSNSIQSEYEWFIDPIDGTTNFIHGLPQFAISIGLCKNKIPILGVIYDPFKKELFTAEKGKGSYLNNKIIKVSKLPTIESAIFCTGIPWRKKDYSGVYIETLRALMDAKCGSIRRLGSAALDLAYVASGRVDGYWEWNLEPYDIAAGIIIVTEAGGYISDAKNTKNYFQSGNIIAANKELHRKIIETLDNKLI